MCFFPKRLGTTIQTRAPKTLRKGTCMDCGDNLMPSAILFPMKVHNMLLCGSQKDMHNKTWHLSRRSWGKTLEQQEATGLKGNVPIPNIRDQNLFKEEDYLLSVWFLLETESLLFVKPYVDVVSTKVYVVSTNLSLVFITKISPWPLGLLIYMQKLIRLYIHFLVDTSAG